MAITDENVSVSLPRKGKHFFALMVDNHIKLGSNGTVDVDTFTNRISTLIHFGVPTVLGNLDHIPRIIFGGTSEVGVNYAFEALAGEFEPTGKLTYDVNYRARLVAADTFAISGYDAFYGFLSGICAGDHDITDIFVDATYRIAEDNERTGEALAAFLKKVDALSKISGTKFTLVSLFF